jgi:hypothetical protein
VVEGNISKIEKVTKMLVDGGSSLSLFTAKVLATLQIPLSRLLDTGVFQGVNGSITRPLGKITLPVTLGDPENFRTEEIVFDIAPSPSAPSCSPHFFIFIMPG